MLDIKNTWFKYVTIRQIYQTAWQFYVEDSITVGLTPVSTP